MSRHPAHALASGASLLDVHAVTPAQRKEIAHYLETGEDEDTADAWPGNVIDREIRQDQALRDARIAEVKRRTRGPRLRTPEVDPVALTRERVDPMVRGLFPKFEHGSDLRCFVTAEYLEQRSSADRSFEDFVVHECAHVLHDAKPYRIGLPERRTRERLVDLEFRKRETFAYAREAYQMVVEHAPRPRDREALLDELVEQGVPGDETVDRAELVDILRDAAQARNGWKRILTRCAEQRARSRAGRA